MDTNENLQGAVRCIGKPNEEVKIYLEEKSDLFLKENMTDRVGHFQLYYLLGREYRLGRQTIYLIRGILEGESGSSRQVHFTAEGLRSLQRRQERQYPNFKVLGWALNQPGYGSDGAWRFAKENEDFFVEAPVLLLGDGLDGSLAFYQWSEGDYREVGGYYVYSDQNPSDFRGATVPSQRRASVQPEEKRMEEGPMPWELPVEGEKKKTVWSYLPLKEKKEPEPVLREHPKEYERARDRQREIRKEKGRQENSPLRVLTSISAVLLMVTLVMGMLLFNSVSTLDGIQSRLETMDMQIEEMHETMTGVTLPEGTDSGQVPASAPAEGDSQ